MKIIISCILFFALLAGSVYGILEVGDEAPELNIEEWMNGTAVNPADADGKTTYVIEFWATWCRPCRRTIPHLNKLAQEYKDDDFVFVGITMEEAETAESFAEDMGVQYRIAFDTGRSTAETYMQGVPGIPHAFVVDKNGNIVWSGHPMSGLDKVLQDIAAGTFDAEANARILKKERELESLISEERLDQAVQALNELIELDPGNFSYYQLKAVMMLENGDYEGVQRLFRTMLIQFQGQADELNTLAWMILNSPPELRNLYVAWEASEDAMEAGGSKDAGHMDTLAAIYHALGMHEDAIHYQRLAVNQAAVADQQAVYQGTLDFYMSIPNVRERIKAARDNSKSAE